MLNKNGKSGHPCLVSDLKKKAFSHLSLSLILALGLSYVAFIMLMYISSIPTLLRGFFFFYHKWVLNFVKGFFCIYWDDRIIFILILLIEYITLTDLWMLNHPCIPGINPTWSWCMILLTCFWIWFADILLRAFASMFNRNIDL